MDHLEVLDRKNRSPFRIDDHDLAHGRFAFKVNVIDDCEEFRHLSEIPCSLPIDEIKIQERLRWDAKTNMILGTCREHGSKRSGAGAS